jgi:hypothetical protein
MDFSIFPPSATNGSPFYEFLEARVGRTGAARIGAFLQEWDSAADDLEHEPSILEYAEYWRMPVDQAREDLMLFRRAFPGEETPSKLLRKLWELRKHSWGALLDVRIREEKVVARSLGHERF